MRPLGRARFCLKVDVTVGLFVMAAGCGGIGWSHRLSRGGRGLLGGSLGSCGCGRWSDRHRSGQGDRHRGGQGRRIETHVS
jgi:hypothetical protein